LFVFVCLFVCLFLFVLFVCLFVCFCFCLFVCLFVCCQGLTLQCLFRLTMTNENMLPNPLENYALNDRWLTDRWNQTPWYDYYLQEQDASSSFWTKRSAKFHYDTITIPVYLVACLFDAYKDFGFDVYRGIRTANGTQPLKLAIVPTQVLDILFCFCVSFLKKNIFSA
jgi:hypothetical protein